MLEDTQLFCIFNGVSNKSLRFIVKEEVCSQSRYEIYNEIRYFSKCFKDEYGMAPSELHKQQ